MGKPTGFKEYERKGLSRSAVPQRLQDYKEFEIKFSDADASEQGARCMDCGIPFCHGPMGCPVDNFIPEWNDLVYNGQWREALDNLHSTNNFPEFTGRLCPAPCEGACVLGINEPAVSIKAIERTIIDKGFENNWIRPVLAKSTKNQSVAVIGSGPAGLAVAQQLAREGYDVMIYEKNDQLGGLLRYGIPDFKMEKHWIDRRLEQLRMEGIKWEVNVHVGIDIHIKDIRAKYNAVVLAGGAEKARSIQIPGSDLDGVHLAMDYLTLQNRKNAGIATHKNIDAQGKDVIVVGGGDTGSDCVGTANRQGAKSVTQIEIMPTPPQERNDSNPWPYWPQIFRVSSSHEEGANRLWATSSVSFQSNNGHVKTLEIEQVSFRDKQFVPVPDTKQTLEADLVLLAMGFVSPVHEGLLTQLEETGLQFDKRHNVDTVMADNNVTSYHTHVDGVFACGDMRRGQSLIVWAIHEGRSCAESVDAYLSKNHE